MGEPVVVGRIGRPHGVRGDVTVDVRTDLPERRFAPGARLVRQVADGPAPRPAAVAAGPADAVGAAAGPAPVAGPASTGDSGAARAAAGPPGPTVLSVVASRWHSGRLLVRFDGVTDRGAAETLRGSFLTIDSDECGPAADPDDEDDDGELWWDRDLVGLRARTPAGDVLGEIVDVIHSPGGDVLAIGRPEGGEYLVPFVREIVPTVDPAAGHIVVDPPPGLLDLD
ncbi:ribosome maturation factor RimM [Parafrankia discariae]|uniref:ribosome maturation factor RimM n=1 Tax=Parafrankia discariae TaxID=365528 RepID=UPI00047818B4|nr:ribosome maturation factor RimM [Parafrankia discariae]